MGLFGSNKNIGGGVSMGGFGAALPQAGDGARPKRGLFGRLGVKPEQVYALGGILQGDPRAAEGYFEAQRAPLLDQAKREAERNEWQWRQQWELDHPKPVNNDTERDVAWYIHASPEEKAAYDALHPVYRIGADGIPYPMARTPQGPPPPDTLPANFDFGGGAPASGAPPFAVSRSQLDNITMMAESGGNPSAVSSAGAKGRMQVMPSTARDPGFGIRPSNGTPPDDERVGREYRAAMQKRYGGDPAKMWGAYNWGPGNLDNALTRHGNDWLRHAPRETQDYVARTLRALRGN